MFKSIALSALFSVLSLLVIGQDDELKRHSGFEQFAGKFPKKHGLNGAVESVKFVVIDQQYADYDEYYAEYNSDGYETLKTSTDYNDCEQRTSVRRASKYGVNGKLETIYKYVGDDKERFTYNANGSLESINSSSTTSVLKKSHSVFTYEQLQDTLKVTCNQSFEAPGYHKVREPKASYLFNNGGQILMKKTAHFTERYRYNSNRNLVFYEFKTSHTPRKPFEWIVVYYTEFNDAGQCTESLSMNRASDDKKVAGFRSKFDTQGNEIESKFTQDFNADSTSFSDDIYQAPILKWPAPDSRKYFVQSYDYTYDSHNNWITKIEYHGSVINGSLSRVIEYY